MTSDLGGLSAPGDFVLNLAMAAGPGHLGRMTMSPQRTPFLLPHATQLNWSVLAAGSLSLEQSIAHWTDTDGDTVTTLRVARDGLSPPPVLPTGQWVPGWAQTPD